MVLSADELRPTLPMVLSGLVQWSGPAFRLKVRMIFERLIRKMGFDEVLEATPPEHHKVGHCRRCLWQRLTALLVDC